MLETVSTGFSQREESATVIWRGKVPGSLIWKRKQLENGLVKPKRNLKTPG